MKAFIVFALILSVLSINEAGVIKTDQRYITVYSRGRSNPTFSYFPTTINEFFFDVRCSTEARIVLTTGPGRVAPFFEIALSGNANIKNAIYKDSLDNLKVSTVVPTLKGNEFKRYRLNWADNQILITESNGPLVLNYKHTGSIDMSYIGFAGGEDAEATFMFEASQLYPKDEIIT